MKHMLYKVFVVAMAAMPLSAVAGYGLSSPNGRLQLTVDITADGQPCYKLDFDGNAVIEPSLLGLSGRQADLTRGFTATDTTMTSHDSTWNPVWGEYAQVREHYNELAVTYVQDNGDESVMTVRFRLFDDGLGFRYELPEQKGINYLTVMDESTEFNLATEDRKSVV